MCLEDELISQGLIKLDNKPRLWKPMYVCDCDKVLSYNGIYHHWNVEHENYKLYGKQLLEDNLITEFKHNRGLCICGMWYNIYNIKKHMITKRHIDILNKKIEISLKKINMHPDLEQIVRSYL